MSSDATADNMMEDIQAHLQTQLPDGLTPLRLLLAS